MENKEIICGNHKIFIKYNTESIVIIPSEPSFLFSVQPTFIDIDKIAKEIPRLKWLTIKDIPIENISNFEYLNTIETIITAKLELLNINSADIINKLPKMKCLSIHSNPLKEQINSVDLSKFETVVLDYEQGMYLDLDNVPETTNLFFTSTFDLSLINLEQMKQLKTIILQIIEDMSKYPNMSELEKTLFLYNYIQKNVEYRAVRFYVNGKEYVDKEIINNANEWTTVFNPYGTLVKNYALCNGIESTIHLILNHPSVNVKCEHIGGYSDNMQHIWNIVYIDGIPYHLDATFDILKNNHLYPNRFKAQKMSTEYFLLSDEEIKRDRQFSNKIYPECENSYPREEIEQSIDRLFDLGLRFNYNKIMTKKNGKDILDDFSL